MRRRRTTCATKGRGTRAVLTRSSLQGVNIAPSAYDLYDENEIVSALAQLIFDHIHLKRY